MTKNEIREMAKEINRVNTLLKNKGEAKTNDYKVAMAYANQINPFINVDVKASYTGGWIIKVKA